MKKAQMSTLATSIVLAVVALMLVWFAQFIVGGTKIAFAGGLCEASAFTMAKTKVLGAESSIINDLKCETQYVKVKDDGIYRYADGKYKKDTAYRGFKDKKEYNIQKVVADEVHQCWRYLGQGTIDPFGKYDGSSKCMICSQIEFEKEISDSYPKFQKFDEFLQQNYVTGESGEQVSYWDYLASGARGEMELELETAPQSVVFISVKPDQTWQIAGQGAGVGIATLGCNPKAIEMLGAALGKIPLPGVARVPGFALKVGGKVAAGGAKTSRFVCAGELLQKGKIASKVILTAGSGWVLTNAAGDEEPRVVMVKLVPTEKVGELCDKLY